MRRSAPLTVQIWSMHAHVRAEPFRIEMRAGPLHLDLDRANALLDVVAITDVRAVSFVVTDEWDGRTPESIRRVCREESWAVTVLGYTHDDAADAMDDALAGLREDISAGRIEKGTHPGRPIPCDPLEPPVEAMLREYRESVLRKLERE